jgi:hypothetical protein
MSNSRHPPANKHRDKMLNRVANSSVDIDHELDEGDTNPNLGCAGLRVVRVANDQHIPRSALLLVPSGFHLRAKV